MSPLVVAAIIFACLFAGALAGMSIRARLPKHHLTKETEDVVRLGIGVIGTMSALVVGLLLASAKGSFDTRSSEIGQVFVDLILVDRQLAQYGPETNETRELLRRYTAERIEAFWPAEASRPVPSDPNSWRLLEDVQNRLRALAPANDGQRWLRDRALQLSADLSRTRWLLRGQAVHGSIPGPFLIVVIFWLTVIFGSFGLFAPRNVTVIMALLVCSLAISGAMFLILEMDQPFTGLIRISSAPARAALALIGH